MLLLGRADVRALLTLEACTSALEAALRAQAEGRVQGPATLSVPAYGGGFHVKAAGLATDHGALFAAKVNGNFPGNPARGRPTIQGVLVLCDADDGTPLALMDSAEITALRTAAATALATRHLARADAATATIVGCGVQGRVQLRAVAGERALQRVFLVDVDMARAEAMAREMSTVVTPKLLPVHDAHAAAHASDIIVTCTTASAPVLNADDVAAGAFVAAVGADNPHKQELDPALVARAAVVVDSLDQCAASGELRYALEAGLMTRDAVRGDLSQVVTGRNTGRRSKEEVLVFDSTGTALQDVAAAAVVYRAAVDARVGLRANISR